MDMKKKHGARRAVLLLVTVTLLSATGLGTLTASAASIDAGGTTGVQINEVYAGNTKTAGDPDNIRCDWVELKNTGSTDVDVSGWGVYDSAKSTKKHYTIGTSAVVPTDTVIKAGGYLVIYIDPDSAEPGLGSDADAVYLSKSSAAFVDADVVDSTEWDSTSTGVSKMSSAQSWARQSDGSFALSDKPTAGSVNPGQDNDANVGDNDAVADTTTSLYLKSIDVGADVVTIASDAANDIDLSGWTIRDNKDDADHIYAIAQSSIIKSGGELSFDLSIPGIGLGKDDAVRVFDATGRQVLQYAWKTDNSAAVLIINESHSTMAEQGDVDAQEPAGNIIKDSDTAVFLKSIDVGTDTVVVGSKAKVDVSLKNWMLKDSDDSHVYTFAADAVLKAGSQISTGTLPFGLGKNDKVRVYNAAGTLILQFSWNSEDGSQIYIANTDADGMQIQQDEDDNPAPIDDAMAVTAWNGLSAVSTVDTINSFGAVSSSGEHTDGNLSGLVYENASKTLWAADNDLNPTLGITGPKGPGSINVFVTSGDTLVQRANNGWSFALDGITKGGKQLHFADGTGGVDAEGITLINASSTSGVFIGAERDNENKNIPRPSILRYDPNQKSTDADGDGAQELSASDEWNLTDELAKAGLTFNQGDDANLGVEGIAYVPDDYLTSHGFLTMDGKAYKPSDYPHAYAGLFLAAIEKNGHIYAFALSNDGGVSLVQDISLPQSATNAGYSGPRDLTWDSEHQQLLAQGDNDSGTGAKIGTYTLSQGNFMLTSLMSTPDEIAGQNSEGFAITPDSQCTTVTGGISGKLYKAVYWSDDGVSNGYSLRQGYMMCDSSATQSHQGTQKEQSVDTVSSSSNAGSNSGSGKNSSVRGLAKTGGVVGGVAVIAMLLAAGVVIVRLVRYRISR
jgi:hypothetical protein